MNVVIQFFKEVNVELSKVIWPKFDDWVGSTIVSLILIVVFSIYLGAIDLGLSRLASYIFASYGMY